MRTYIYVAIWLTAIFITSCKNKAAQQSQPPNKTIAKVPKLQHGADVTDYDGNTYHTIIIGDQTWLAENLKVTHYNNGDKIPLVTSDKLWGLQTAGAYCNYTNDEGNVNGYGRLYNWHTVTDVRKLAPKGWHVPTEQEWKILLAYLGGDAVAASKLSATETSYWEAPNNTATNQSGFTALPAGNRNNNGMYENKGFSAAWWTTTGETQADFATNYSIYNNSMKIKADVNDRICGFSVRCLKDR